MGFGDDYDDADDDANRLQRHLHAPAAPGPELGIGVEALGIRVWVLGFRVCGGSSLHLST